MILSFQVAKILLVKETKTVDPEVAEEATQFLGSVLTEYTKQEDPLEREQLEKESREVFNQALKLLDERGKKIEGVFFVRFAPRAYWVETSYRVTPTVPLNVNGNDIQVSLAEHIEGTPEGEVQTGSFLVEVSSENYEGYGKILFTPMLEIKPTETTSWARRRYRLDTGGIKQVGKLISFLDQTLATSTLGLPEDVNQLPQGQNMFRVRKIA